MSVFLLRLEGVNLSNFVYNTEDLSTVRGGGLLLLDAAPKVREFLRGAGCTVDPVVEGASIGLFRVESTRAAEKVRHDVVAWLTNWLPHATFVVDIDESGAEFPVARAAVWAKNRWRQMQSPTLVYPALNEVTRETEVCQLDGVRPGTILEPHAPDSKQRQSESGNRRRRYGQQEKQRFYNREMSRAGPPNESWPKKYTLDFEDLCGKSSQWGNLRDKMAVIYLDGNKFGEIGVKQCPSPEEQAAFSIGVRDEHAKVLRRLIEERIPEVGWSTDDAEQVRLETLLWGGDEIVWVVPAWKGWETLEFFFSAIDGRPAWNRAPYPLTYSAGLVFCHQKAPIHTIEKLARKLAEKVKESNRTGNNPYQNRFLYKVLESFDYVGEVNDEYLPLILPAEVMHEMSAAMTYWREWISRKKLHRILKEPADMRGIAAEIERDLGRAGTGDAEVALTALTVLEGAKWKHIAELWDYVAPERSEA